MENFQNSIDNYIKDFPKGVQIILGKIRVIIQNEAPEAKETIKYGIPTFVMNGNLVHFAAFKNHIGFYPTPSAIETFKEELSVYKCAKGTVQFPLQKSIPYDLIRKIVAYRVHESKVKGMKK